MLVDSTDSKTMPDRDFEHIPEPAFEHLNPRQGVDYNEHRSDLKEWLRTVGKDPDNRNGYSSAVVSNYANRLDQFYRWVWVEYDGYTTRITHEHADEYVEGLAEDDILTQNGEPYGEGSKRKMANAIRALFNWRARKREGAEWDSPIAFSDRSYSPADEFTIDERRRLREAALEYDSIPAYGDLSPEERDRWKAYLAQKLGKPKRDVSPTDWEGVNRSWKVPSLIHVTLDTGLRPCEVEQSRVSWIRAEKKELHVPKDDSAKNRDYWQLSLLPKTVKILERWLEQRENHTMYDETDDIWLNREGNRYRSGSLNIIVDNLCEQAGIGQENRQLVWYSFRHSLGTHMANEGGIEQAKEQLRHKSLESTLRYVRPSHEKRRETLNRIG